MELQEVTKKNCSKYIPQVHPGAGFSVVDLNIHIGKECYMIIELSKRTSCKSLPPTNMTN